MKSAAVVIAVLLASAGIVESATAPAVQSESLTRKSGTQIIIEVQDPTGAAIPNAAIECQPVSEISRYRASTDIYGRVTLVLDPGIYNFVVTEAGFRPFSGYFEVDGTTPRVVTVPLQIGGCSPRVEVTSLAPGNQGVTSLAPANQGNPQFSVSIRSLEGSVEAGHEIRLFVTATMLRNGSWSPDPNGQYLLSDYKIEARDAVGQEPPQSRLLKSIRGTDTCLPRTITASTPVRQLAVTAATGATFNNDFNLTALYDLSKPGNYTVQLSRTDDAGHEIKSNALRLKVAPRKTPLPFAPLPENPAPPPAILLTLWPAAQDPFALDAVTKNLSDHPITLKGQGFVKDANGTLQLIQGNAVGSVYKVDVRNDLGESPDETALGKEKGVGDDRPADMSHLPEASVSLKPGEEWHDTVYVGSFYDLGINGEYTIRLRRWDDDTHAWVISNAFTGVVSNGRTRLQVLFSRASGLLGRGRYGDAAPLLEQALPLASGNRLVQVEDSLADAYLGLHSYDKAVSHYQRAMALDPSNGMHHMKLGGAYVQMGRIPEAVAELKKSAELAPQIAATTEYNIGVIYYSNGQMDEAIQAFRIATEKDPKLADAYLMLGFSLFSKGQPVADGKMIAPSGTVEALETYLKLKPDGSRAEEARRELNIIKKAATSTQN